MREHSIRPRAAVKATMSLLLVWLALGGCVAELSEARYEYEVPSQKGGRVAQVEIVRHAEKPDSFGCATTFAGYKETPPYMFVDGRPATREEYEYYLPLLYIPSFKRETIADSYGIRTEFYEFPAMGDVAKGIRPKS